MRYHNSFDILQSWSKILAPLHFGQIMHHFSKDLWRSQNSSWEKAPFKSETHLEQLAKEEWSKIPVERCKKLIDGYRK